MTYAELTSLEARQARVADEMAWLRERIRVVRDDAEVRLAGDIAEIQGRMVLLKLELKDLRETVESEG